MSPSARAALCYALVVIALGLGVCSEATQNDASSSKVSTGQATDLRNIVIVIHSQSSHYNALAAGRLKEDFLQQAQKLQQVPPTIVLLHKVDEVAGAWTIFPALPRLLSTHGGSATWWFFCEEETRVDLERLRRLLGRYDHSKPWFLGRALHDESATIIHNFAFHEDPTSFHYPLFSSGWALSQPLLASIVQRWTRESRRADFTIDLKHEASYITHRIALYIWNKGQGTKLTPTPEFCIRDAEAQSGGTCATTVYTDPPQCGEPVEDNKIFFAIKTCHKFYIDRVPVLKRTWGTRASRLTFYSDTLDADIPTVDLGVPNTERGHCAKTFAILERFNSDSTFERTPWLVIADDDSLLSVPRLQKLLSCYDPTEPVYLGERYGYGLLTGGGYSYITGGGGMVFSREAVKKLMGGGCKCYSDDAPDDMVLGMCFKSLEIPATHSPQFHQARPEDYPLDYLTSHSPVSFHKHWNTDPYHIYERWLAGDDRTSSEGRVIGHREL
ncbi:unnamed protein product [Lampetra planeri]